MNTRAGDPATGSPHPARGAAGTLGAPLRALAGNLRLWFGLSLCGAMFLGWAGIAYALRPFLTVAQRRRIGRGGMQRMFHLYLRTLQRCGIVEVDNDALLPLRHERSLILAPNHPSMMDVLLVISRLDNVGCIMKADLWGSIFLGAGARLAGFIRNDSPHSMIKLAVGDLERGSQLLIFPEATRTVRSPVNRLSGGYALIAKKSNAPIQTILIETDSPYLRKGWPLLRRPPMPIRFRLRLGKRFQPRDDVDELVADMERYYIEELGATGRDAAAVGSAPEPPRSSGDPA
jgi:1-acyl-sn-glycerol-3-phosphate acyltransferase